MFLKKIMLELWPNGTYSLRMKNKIKTAIGLMSGTSLDGIDAAIISTDGIAVQSVGESHSHSYTPAVREKIRQLLKGGGDIKSVEKDLTILHADVVNELLAKANLKPSDIDIIGFHGQTIKHEPHNKYTLQIGDGALLAELTGIDVVNDMRSNDVRNGGQGAPLVPLYHAALAHSQQFPIAMVNIGGVGNVTWVGDGDNIVAFDTGTGNALLDDWMLKHKGVHYDENGKTAATGKPDAQTLNKLLTDDYFNKKPPKSLDRNHFIVDVTHLSLEDGAATLADFTVKSIAAAAKHFPAPAKKWYITGGGRHNDYIMQRLAAEISAPVLKIENLGYNGDMLEAEAFAFLAVRSLYGMPLSLPSTTGVPKPLTGGVLHKIGAKC
jgi:anhydro-N-acetylmuramic acid kinase